MGLAVHRVEKRLYWVADRSRLVSHGDPDAAFLAFPAGAEMSLNEARRFGLLHGPDTEKLGPEPENKLGARAANKGIKATGAGARVENNIVEPATGRER